MAKATLNKNGIATKAGDITVYNYDGLTREYLTPSVEYLAVGVGIPANSSPDAPPEVKEGFAVCRAASSDGWEYLADHRGETVFDTTTGQPIHITAPGDYADNVTTIAPSTPYDKWNGSEWVTDENALKNGQIREAERKKSALLAGAQSTISLWQTELQLGIISDDDKASLITWMKYIRALNAVDTATAPFIEWPVKPE
ncbi:MULTISPECIES: tail fiber assembly protein [unclassified Enterobacter]|uniref:tail fiber assembly protein n=1 Tax=unclassified Enterobacter TaxID=2608935 RepID=UPI0021487963|nr:MULTISPECIES: tail fiber assembly protein [unclassified Enterobacter]MCR1301097.1 tail fiber assembly protein [Enterobacter sp. FL1277]MCR1305930.1 tail fiber assembly protein [Enterobacter sp. BT1271]MCR1313262.1 tail fiber assembly protein [Enterobacter sp. BT855]MCR1323170.1 tail fiber assembly protein [Enterobacter sp. BT1268]MCR1328623.1 tail fiber assembly protein [Enterobacter sp. BT1131]